MDSCQLCGRNQLLTFHHLIPRSCHKNKWFKKRYAKETMQSCGIIVCEDCHGFIHKQFSEKQLGREFNGLEQLRQQPIIAEFVRWVRKKH